MGAGISGVSAAIEASRLGRKVVLVDGLPSLGGQAVNSIIGTICGLFSNGPNARQLTHGIADDILCDLGKQGAAHLIRRPMTITVYYDEVALSRWVETTVRAAGIQVVVGAVLRKARLEGRRITELLLATRSWLPAPSLWEFAFSLLACCRTAWRGPKRRSDGPSASRHSQLAPVPPIEWP